MKTWKEFIDYIEGEIVKADLTESNGILDFEDGWQVEITSLVSDEGHICGFDISRWNCDILDCLINHPGEEGMEVIFVHWDEDAAEGTSRFFGVVPGDFDVSTIIETEDSFEMMDDMFDWIHSL